MNQTELKRISRAKYAKLAKNDFCHFDQREKSFLDPLYLLGMTGVARRLGVLCALCALCARHSLIKSSLRPENANFFG
jgi:hypothetical protein